MKSITEIQEALVGGAEVVSGYYQVPERVNVADVARYHDRLTELICDKLDNCDRGMLLSRRHDPEVWEDAIVIQALKTSDLDHDYEIGETVDALLNRLPGDPKSRSRDRERRRSHRTGHILKPGIIEGFLDAEPVLISPADDEEDNQTGLIQAGGE